MNNTTDTDIQWAEAPPLATRGRKDSRLMAFVQQLETRPGHWAIYPYDVTASAVTGARRRYPDTEWTVRNCDKPDQTIYARWVGQEGGS